MITIKELPVISQCRKRPVTNEELNQIRRTDFGVTVRLEEGDVIEFGAVETKRKHNVLIWQHPLSGIRMFLVRCKINGIPALIPLSIFKRRHLNGHLCPILKHLTSRTYLQITQYLNYKRFRVKTFSTCIGPSFSKEGELIGERTVKVPYIIHCK